jgi:23S rRNA pseudouridine2605 synthase
MNRKPQLPRAEGILSILDERPETDDHLDSEDDSQLAFLGKLDKPARIGGGQVRPRAGRSNNGAGRTAPASNGATIDAESERIQKVLAAAGFASRREVEEWIVAGRVSVNGLPSFLGQKIGPGDRVKVNGKLVNVKFAQQRKNARVLMYHKPEGEIGWSPQRVRSPAHAEARALDSHWSP